MAHKELKYDVEARNALQAGVDAVANAVKVTLGPRGRYVVLDKKFGAPTITNDGVTIAREIEVEDVDRKSTRLNSSHANISYAVFCLKKKSRTSDRKSTHLNS